jgi:glycosyltransferase involved in cell wall biosynthesis
MAARPRLLDLTRLTSRAGRVLTGVDRVELAYLRALLGRDDPVFGLVRTVLGFVLLDRVGMAAFAAAVQTGQWGKPDRIAALARLDPALGAAQALVRRHARARCLPVRLAAMLQRHLPPGVAYLNVGHSNLTDRVLRSVRLVPGAQISVMIHDTIPLDHPDWQRDGTAAAFADKFRRATDAADLIISTSAAARSDILRSIGTRGRTPAMVTARLGVSPAQPDPSALPAGLDLTQPYFIAVGTIEPRKNLTLLLDAWDLLGPAAPGLFIVGGGGWKNDAVLARIAGAGPRVRLLSGLTDGAVAALVANARALLMPSLAEGFGLPVPEALALGTPVVVSPLPIWGEIAGDRPVVLPGDDPYLWAQTVTQMTAQRLVTATYVPPDWEAHFKAVLSVT